MNEVLNFIFKNASLENNDYVVIGLSGGPDSMALVHLLMEVRKKININIVCAHVNHNIRKESDDEEKFVKEYCKNNNLIFEYTRFSYEKRFTESLAHNMRYEFFESLIHKYNAKYIFTAHHGDDLIETVLMRLVRGSSLKGSAGFNSIVKRDGYDIIRPLVLTTKEEILVYVKMNYIPYVVDKSNESDLYTRNRYRNHILPLLKEEDRKVHLKFLKYSNMIYEYNELIEELVNDKYNKYLKDNKMYINELKNEKDIIIKEVLYKWLYSLYNDDIVLINDNHINMLIDNMRNEKPNIDIDLPKYKIIKEYDYLRVGKKVNNEDYFLLLDDNIDLDNGMSIRINNDCALTTNYVTHLNSEDLKLPLYVRNVSEGDIMSIKNMNGHKNISDIFINEKVSLNARKNYPVVVDCTGTIIWLPGLKKSSFDRKKDGKYDIILEYYLREE